MVCNAEPVVVNHGVIFWASGCEPWLGKMKKWLWISVCYVELLGVQYDVLCSASGC
jgi:hypothetical protein